MGEICRQPGENSSWNQRRAASRCSCEFKHFPFMICVKKRKQTKYARMELEMMTIFKLTGLNIETDFFVLILPVL